MGLGLDFKFLSGARDAVMYYSKELSNLFIVSEEVLADAENNTVLTQMKNDGIVWDLMVIDTSECIDGINPALYTENIGMKADRVLIFAPTPAAYTDSPDCIKEIVTALSAKDADVSAPINADTMKFSMDNPYLNYPDESSTFAKSSLFTILSAKAQFLRIFTLTKFRQVCVTAQAEMYSKNTTFPKERFI